MAGAVTTPELVVAGGIMDGRGLMAALALGAAGVQMGTAFLTCTESATHPAHQQAIFDSNDQSTVLTNVFSGRYARGIYNTFIKEMESFESDMPAYLIQNMLTADIRKTAGAQHNQEYMSLWAGQASPLARKESAAALIERTIAEADERIGRLLKRTEQI